MDAAAAILFFTNTTLNAADRTERERRSPVLRGWEPLREAQKGSRKSNLNLISSTEVNQLGGDPDITLAC